MIDTPEHPPTNEEMGSSEELDASDIEQTELQGETPPGELSTDDTSSSLPLEQRGSFLDRLSNRVQHYWVEHKNKIIAVAGAFMAVGVLTCLFVKNSESDSSEYEAAESSDDDSTYDDSDLFSTEDNVSSEISDSDEQICCKSPREHTVNS